MAQLSDLLTKVKSTLPLACMSNPWPFMSDKGGFRSSHLESSSSQPLSEKQICIITVQNSKSEQA